MGTLLGSCWEGLVSPEEGDRHEEGLLLSPSLQLPSEAAVQFPVTTRWTRKAPSRGICGRPGSLTNPGTSHFQMFYV